MDDVTSESVFSRTKPVQWTADVAVIGGPPCSSVEGVDERELESDADLAFAFRHAAGVIAADWYRQRKDDSLVLVVLYNYRHALELGLKAVIKSMIASLQFEEPAQKLTVEQEQVLARARSKHDLSLLLDDLSALAQHFQMPLPEVVRTACEKLHELDPDGQWFRYATVRSRTRGADSVAARPDPIYVDVPRLSQLAETACSALDDLLDRTHELQDWQTSLGPEHDQEAHRRAVLVTRQHHEDDLHQA
ncbi:hypothetical protein [Nonomuraea sp. CA-141351]|uniref:hypothetical protein n=1 Tax=Nonomuraea sp. CA-141351 TaxID=3239996 RepID=UPI003D8A8A4F